MELSEYASDITYICASELILLMYSTSSAQMLKATYLESFLIEAFSSGWG